MIRGIAIFLVVAGHSGLIGAEWNIWLSTFHLPAFFFVSGMLMQEKKEDGQSLVKVIKHKAKGILIPYFWFSLGALLIDVFQVFRGYFTSEMLKEHIIQTITFQGYSVLWFLPVLFLSELLVLLLLKIIRAIRVKQSYRPATALICCVCLAVAAYYLYYHPPVSGMNVFLLGEIRILVKALIATGFISCGYFTAYGLASSGKGKCRQKKGIKGFFSQFNLLGILAGVVLSAINFAVIPYVQLMDFNNVNIGNPLLYLCLGTTGSLGLICICRSIPNIPLITFYGQNSLIVMCTHLKFYILNAGMIIGRDVFVPLPGPDGLQFMISSLVCTMLLEIPVILIIRIFFPFMLGCRHNKMTAVNKKN